MSLLTGFTLIATVASYMLLGSIWAGMGWRFNFLLSLIALCSPLALSLRATHWLSGQPQWAWPPSRQTPWGIGSLVGLGVTLAIVFFSWFWAQWFDLSWDSLFYHKESLIQLAWGWNPMADPIPSRDYFPMLTPLKNLDYIAHASHAIEVAGAVIYSWTHLVESGKVINTLILLSTGCFAYTFANLLIPAASTLRGFRELSLIAVAVLAAFNPVSVSQLSILYNDGVITNLLISLILCAAVVIRDKPQAWHGLCLFPCLMVVAATKLTGIFFSGIFTTLTLLWLWRWKKMIPWRGIAGITLCYFVSVVIISSNPFIIDLPNWLPRERPQTIASQQAPPNKAPLPKIDIDESNRQARRLAHLSKKPLYERMMDNQGNQSFLSQPSVIKFMQSLNAIPNVDITGIPALHNPFKVTADSWYFCRYPDLRLGGLGPLFPVAFWLSLLALPWFIVQRRQPSVQAVIVCLGMLVISVAVFPESWWMRFVGFFSLWPLLVTLGLLATPYRWKQIPVSAYLCVVLLSVIALNNAGVGITRLAVDWDHSQAVHREMDEIKQMDMPYGLLAHADLFGSFRFIPYEYGIPFHTLLSPCPTSLQPVHPIRIKNELFQLRMFPFFYNQVCYLEGLPKQRD